MRILFENRKVKLLSGSLLALLCPLICWILGYSAKTGTLIMLFLFIVTSIRVEADKKRIVIFFYVLFSLFGPAMSLYLGFLVQDIYDPQLNLFRILLNLFLVYCLQIVVLLVFVNIRLSVVVGFVIPYLFALINAYVYSFRGTALMPTDILSVNTAMNVAGEYDLTPTPIMIYTMFIIAGLCFSSTCIPHMDASRSIRTMALEIAGITACVCVIVYGISQCRVHYWYNDGAIYNGILLNFVMQIKDTFVKEPDGYSKEVIEELSAQCPVEKTPRSRPDIVVIMDESFADFRVFGESNIISNEIMPYIDSLREDTIRGYLTASVFGGSTANSEYEFLSGNTMAFLPQGSIVYQQYYSGDSWSLVSYLNDCGYDCVAMHPYHASGWMRPTVYPQMGFQKMYFLDDFPQKQMIREYVSDQEMFEYIIEYHEQHNADTPMFLFGITMQNHGSYEYEGADFQPTVSAEGYPMAEQYLTVVQESDRAVEFLIEYYKNVARDTVIVFFGDHMPNVEPAFYKELNGGPFVTLDDQMKKQMVPFFVWANFDIEEQEIPCSSINYLPLYTLEAAGLPLPPYMQFLKDTESVIPAINAYGYYSAQKQCFLPLEEATGAEADAIRRYEFLQYNNMFDENGRSEHFFGN